MHEPKNAAPAWMYHAEICARCFADNAMYLSGFLRPSNSPNRCLCNLFYWLCYFTEHCQQTFVPGDWCASRTHSAAENHRVDR